MSKNFHSELLLFSLIFYAFTSNIAAAAIQESTPDEIDPLRVIQTIGQVFHQPGLAEELGILEKQKKELGDYIIKFQKGFQELNSKQSGQLLTAHESLMKNPSDNDAREFIEEHQKLTKEFAGKQLKELNDILLPHQIERLDQLTQQAIAARQSKFQDEFGVAYAMAKRIGLTRSEKAALKKATTEARKVYYRKLRLLKQETHEKVLDSLPNEKQDILKKIIGDYFDDSDLKVGEVGK